LLAMPRNKDADLQLNVLEELRWDPRVSERDIRVDSNGGVVSLSGSVPSFAQKVAAGTAASRVEGVVNVVNGLAVNLPENQRCSDLELARAVRDALEWCVFVPDKLIHSTVTDGWVTLDGTVRTLAERADAVAAIERLQSVQGIINQISVESPIMASPRIRVDIEKAIGRQATCNSCKPGVTVTDGVVTLSGQVCTSSEKNAINQIAAGTSGVREVIDRLTVDSRARPH
jgi:osmotically-inducible protein OsmY